MSLLRAFVTFEHITINANTVDVLTKIMTGKTVVADSNIAGDGAIAGPNGDTTVTLTEVTSDRMKVWIN